MSVLCVAITRAGLAPSAMDAFTLIQAQRAIAMWRQGTIAWLQAL